MAKDYLSTKTVNYVWLTALERSRYISTTVWLPFITPASHPCDISWVSVVQIAYDIAKESQGLGAADVAETSSSDDESRKV